MTRRRIKAFLFDYLLILLYMGLLFGVTMLISGIGNMSLQTDNMLLAQSIAFLTLTVPVILYFCMMEAGSKQATFGKQRFNLRVIAGNDGRAGVKQIIARNCLKFLPWELAHFFVFQLLYYERHELPAPAWVLAGLIFAQLLALGYLFMALRGKRNRALYEIVSGTSVAI